MKKIALEIIITICSVLTLGSSFIINNVNAKSKVISVPLRYRHNWYGKKGFSKNFVYRIRKNYAYFNQNNGKGLTIKYKYKHLKNGWYGVISTNGGYESVPFKIKGNHLVIGYDTATFRLYR
ncbi:hypothetical protein DY138_02670 [Apilactobacillus timberlakei]|uniref:hypothetical protein n=1 Tax=Apilactobacillus timberlakei TaxID=2008380 RepID=UPI00112C5A02|nr:hypothetical protein [Apilactobacillus timberlakei]TPR19565.1 hypothetical protein DY138_02670 [Apilactobacillus timberlakei]TPR20542.1 hypothetical protein DY061_04310 [Apilactobacillus timberlakei]TPR22586.1 hypothetical protein DY083_03580 [Apilactobacillus timberlakei]